VVELLPSKYVKPWVQTPVKSKQTDKNNYSQCFKSPVILLPSHILLGL
jgi:hypothetical protein